VEALERDLVLAAKAGDRKAFKMLAERYYPRMFKMLVAMTRDRETAQDLTQETFVRALQAIGEFNMTSAFYTWLYRIATNAALDVMRRARTAGARDEYDDGVRYTKEAAGESLHWRPADPLRAVETEESLQVVRECMEMLRPEFREILVLREVEEMSYEEIAEILGVKMGTVMSRLFNARMRLREMIEARMGRQGMRRARMRARRAMPQRGR
jgi:RNA polymerase sigma-70 factor (ECF subfamily)